MPTSSHSPNSLPDFGQTSYSGNADPFNEIVPVNAPMNIHYSGKNIHLSQGASKSAITMINYFRKPSIARRLIGRKVLELGCGTGLAGISAIMQGAHVDFTDQSIVVGLLESNVKNNLDPDQLENARFAELQWHDNNCDHHLVKNKYDYLIAADVVYARESIAPIVETLEKFSREDTIIFLAYVHRFPWAEEFFEQMDEKFNRKLIEYSEGVWLFQFNQST